MEHWFQQSYLNESNQLIQKYTYSYNVYIFGTSFISFVCIFVYILTMSQLQKKCDS